MQAGQVVTSRTAKRNALRRLGEEDYELKSEYGHCWITVGDISVKVGTTGDGVCVELFAKGCEDIDAYTDTFMSFDNARYIIDEDLREEGT